MDTAIKVTKKKVIDIPEDNIMNDNEAYKWLSEHEPEGHVMVSKAEKQDFENWLGIQK